MLLNLNDPASILAWWKVLPERHDSFLTYKLRASPEFAPAILEAQRRIADDPELRDLLVQTEHQRRQAETGSTNGHLPGQEVTRAEFAVA